MGCEHPKLHVLMVFIDFCPENPFKVHDGTNVRMESIPGRLVFRHRFWVSEMVSYLPTPPIVDCIRDPWSLHRELRVAL